MLNNLSDEFSDFLFLHSDNNYELGATAAAAAAWLEVIEASAAPEAGRWAVKARHEPLISLPFCGCCPRTWPALTAASPHPLLLLLLLILHLLSGSSR
jgi:hypothetical protein